MKLFDRTPGYWLFYISAAYLTVGLISLYNNIDNTFLGPLWVVFLSMPFWFPPLGRAINMDVTWDLKMFEFFKNKGKDAYSDEATSNVYNLPVPKAVPPVPEVKKEEPARIFYRFGITDQKDRVAFQMGHSEITMNKQGCQDLIDQITFFMDRLEDSND